MVNDHLVGCFRYAELQAASEDLVKNDPQDSKMPDRLREAGIESGELSGVSPPVRRLCTGKLTHAARQLSHSRRRGV